MSFFDDVKNVGQEDRYQAAVAEAEQGVMKLQLDALDMTSEGLATIRSQLCPSRRHLIMGILDRRLIGWLFLSHLSLQTERTPQEDSDELIVPTDLPLLVRVLQGIFNLGLGSDFVYPEAKSADDSELISREHIETLSKEVYLRFKQFFPAISADSMAFLPEQSHNPDPYAISEFLDKWQQEQLQSAIQRTSGNNSAGGVSSGPSSLSPNDGSLTSGSVDAAFDCIVSKETWRSFCASPHFLLYAQLSHYILKEAPDTREHFELVAPLGVGGFGCVHAVRHLETSAVYALKEMSKSQVAGLGPAGWSSVRAERNILQQLSSHPFIVTLYCAFQTSSDLCLVLELCPGGDLTYHLKRSGKMTEDQVRFYASQIVLALEHIHESGFVYRDLKPSNVLIGSDGYARLSDFGMAISQRNSDELTRLAGTPGFWAPEIILGQGASPSSDCWSLGVLLYSMLQGALPKVDESGSSNSNPSLSQSGNQFPDSPIGIPIRDLEEENASTVQVSGEVLWSPFERAEGLAKRARAPGARMVDINNLAYPRDVFSADAESLIRSLLVPDPQRRLGIKEVKSHPFFLSSLSVSTSGGQAEGKDDAQLHYWGRVLARKLPPPFVPEPGRIYSQFIASRAKAVVGTSAKVPSNVPSPKFDEWGWNHVNHEQKERAVLRMADHIISMVDLSSSPQQGEASGSPRSQQTTNRPGTSFTLEVKGAGLPESVSSQPGDTPKSCCTCA